MLYSYERSMQANSREDGEQTFLRFWMLLLIKSSSLKLVSEHEIKRKQYSTGCSLRNQLNYITFNNPFSSDYKSWFEGGSSKRFLSRFLHIIYLVYTLYLIIKFSLLSTLKYQHDNFLSNMEVRVYQNATLTSKECALAKDIYYHNPKIIRTPSVGTSTKLYQRYEILKHLLMIIGDPMISVSGIGVLLTFLVTVIISLYFFGGFLYLRKNPTRLDTLSLILYPLSELERLENELRFVIEDFKETLKNNIENRGFKEMCSYFAFRDRQQASKQQEAEAPVQLQEEQSGELRETLNAMGLNYFLVSKINYYDILYQIQFSSLINPKELTFKKETYYNLCKYICLTLIIIGASSSMFACIFVTMVELYNRVGQRFQQIKCQRWNPEAGLPLKMLVVEQRLSSPEEVDLYVNYTGQAISHYLRLMLVESKYLLTTSNIISQVEITFILFASCLWMNLYVSVYTTGQTQKFAWLDEVQREIMSAIEMIRRIRLDKHQAKFSQNSNSEDIILEAQKGQAEGVDEEEGEEEEEEEEREEEEFVINNDLIKQILISYLNFELFRRQYRKFKKLTDFMFLQMAFVAGTCMLICYLTNKFTNATNKPFLLVGCTATVFLVNVFLVVASKFSKKFENLMKSIVTLVVVSNWVSMQQSLIIELWRRQIIEKRELNDQYSPKFFGAHISSASILTVNLYLAALWWYLLSGKTI